jgi:hypothetical protein
MTAMNLDLRPTIGERAPLAQRHPRGRGLAILSRLARAEDDWNSPQHEATVLAFEPREHTPRHRRDV